jgi:hypothetical protein
VPSVDGREARAVVLEKRKDAVAASAASVIVDDVTLMEAFTRGHPPSGALKVTQYAHASARYVLFRRVYFQDRLKGRTARIAVV